jgi:hypothetical protein
MAIVFDILEDERNRLLELRRRYEEQIADLPKGTLVRKPRWNKAYYYRAYRESARVKFVYVGPEGSEPVLAVAQKISQRKNLEVKLRGIKEDLNHVDRGLRGKR